MIGKGKVSGSVDKSFKKSCPKGDMKLGVGTEEGLHC